MKTILFLCLLLPLTGFSQNLFLKEHNLSGSNENDYDLFGDIKVVENNYYVSGIGKFENDTTNMFVAKFNQKGDLIFITRLKQTWDDLSLSCKLARTNNAKLLLIGNYTENYASQMDLYIGELDTNLILIKENIISLAPPYLLNFMNVSGIENKYFIASGYIQKKTQPSSVNGFLCKINSTGDTLWLQEFISPNTTETGFWDVVESFTPGRYLVVGLMRTQIKNKLYYLETDSTGNIFWSKMISGLYRGSQLKKQLESTSDGNYIITYPSDTIPGKGIDIVILKIAPDGTIISSINLGDTLNDYAYELVKAGDDFILTGETNSNSSQSDMLLMKFDQNLNVVWEHTYKKNVANFGSGIDFTSENNIIVSGGTNNGVGVNSLLLKVDSMGNISTSINDLNNTKKLFSNNFLFSGQGDLNIQVTGTVEIFSVYGQLLFSSISNGNFSYHCEHLSPGMYFIRVSNQRNNSITYHKIMKVY